MTRLFADNNHELDTEWVELITRAKSQGYSTEDVRKIIGIIKETTKLDEVQGSAV